ncbi:MAG: PatB family C-S lyase [Sulfurimonas sp.]|nr:PatB family C-S lyase [Sulfurimonas sp.]
MEEKMSYDFRESACRKDTNAEKYTLRQSLFNTQNIMPVWVADMDIDTPNFVLDAVKKRLEHPIVGYEEVPNSVWRAQLDWMKNHHGFEYKIQDVFYSHSVVASMGVAINAFSEVGDKIIVQTPVYPPFFQSIINNDRVVIKNSLKLDKDGSYSFDINDLKSKIDKDTKLLLLCSPHNPVGRVWRREELEEILKVCIENNIVVFSDEIHSDLVYAPNKHIPFATLSQEAKNITITAVGVGKTFNMAGFAMSSVIIENEDLKKRFFKSYKHVHFAEGSTLSHVAFESAYTNGDLWLRELREHLFNNYKLLESLCLKFSDDIKITPIEATYLAWLDCRGMGLSNKKLRGFFIKEAKLGLNAGLSFGREGSGFMRLNFAVSSAKMSQIVLQLESALKNRK